MSVFKEKRGYSIWDFSNTKECLVNIQFLMFFMPISGSCVCIACDSLLTANLLQVAKVDCQNLLSTSFQKFSLPMSFKSCETNSKGLFIWAEVVSVAEKTFR